MLQVARLSPILLHESADLVHSFLISKQNDDGGFQGRTPDSDLYYTLFGTEALLALQQPLNNLESYLDSVDPNTCTDLVDLACYARLHAALKQSIPDEKRQQFEHQLSLLTADHGGYGNTQDNRVTTAYTLFLSAGLLQDSGNHDSLDNLETAPALERLKSKDGGYNNSPRMPQGSSPATAAALTIQAELSAPIDQEASLWLQKRHYPRGGFFAAAATPVPDLLTTAVSLHALASINVDLSPFKEPCLDFMDSLWDSKGSFYGNWTESDLDTEYTWYALLALGHLYAAGN